MPARWKGTITWALVSVPVTLAPPPEELQPPLHEVHAKDKSPLKRRRFCEAEDVEVENAEVAKAYDAPTGQTVLVTGEELKELPVASKRRVHVLRFLPKDAVDPIIFGKPYYVTADRGGAMAYVLLRDALRESERVAVTKVAISTRESPAVLRPYNDVLLLQLTAWPAELRSSKGIAPEGETVRPQEMRMAMSLMEEMSEGSLDDDLQDDYAIALQQLVDAKLHGLPTPRRDEEEAGTAPDNVVDLMALLRRSREQHAQERGHEPAAAARKTATRKTTGDAASKKTAPGGKKAAAKKTTPAKKSAAKPAARKPATPRRAA